MCAGKERCEHQDEWNDVGKQACSESLANGTDQCDGVSDVQCGIVPFDVDDLFFAFAAAAELAGTATASGRCLQDAHGAMVCSDFFYDAFVFYGLFVVHYADKGSQSYVFL